MNFLDTMLPVGYINFMKDRKRTEQDLIDAVDTIVREKGIHKLGINAVAKQAGVSKVLIYRYFGGYDELLEAWALHNSYWVGRLHNEPISDDYLSAGLKILQGQVEAVRNDPMLREIERWLLQEKSAATEKVMEKLEQRGLALTKEFTDNTNVDGTDIEAFIALITAGINYLALKGDRCDIYNGIRLDTDEGWNRISTVITSWAKSVFGKAEKK